MPTPNFLDLPPQPDKPRRTGLTHVLDPGVPPETLAAVLGSAANHIDIWKSGWGTAYVDPMLDRKLELLAEYDVAACLGGTLLEIAYARGRARECLAWAADVGFRCVEVSRGTVAIPLADKRALIERAVRDFTVLAEVGSKDPRQQLATEQWPVEAEADLRAGASWVVAEGRQTGTVGIYDAAGQVREELVWSLCERVGAAAVIFEAPRAAQQAWFVRTMGAAVNLGNIAAPDVLGVQTLRLGLRSDTAHLALPAPELDGDWEWPSEDDGAGLTAGVDCR